jgi:short-subunit dehydrogenase
VTGAASGIGEAVAREFAARGATVVAVDRRPDRLPEILVACRATSPDSFTHTADVSSRADCDAAVSTTIERLGRVDILVNNAGVPLHKHVAETRIEDIEAMMSVNFFGAVYLTYAALPHMLAQRRGSIVNISSVAGYIPNPREAAYGASKAALSLWTHGLSNELAGSGVHAGVLSPGPTATSIWREFSSPVRYRGKMFPPRVVALAAARMIEREKTHMTAPRRYGMIGALYPLLGRQIRWGLRRFDAKAQRKAGHR